MLKPGSSWIYLFQIYPCKIVLVLYQLPFKFCFLQQQFSCTVKKLDTSRICLNVPVMNRYFSAYDSHISSHVGAMGSLHPSFLWKKSTLFVNSSFRQRCGIFAWDPQAIHVQWKRVLSFVAVNPFWKCTSQTSWCNDLLNPVLSLTTDLVSGNKDLRDFQ